MPEHSQNQRERLNYLEFRLYFTGQISRADLIQRFGISEAAATRDLATYRDEAADNLEFDTSKKCYRISETFSLNYLKDVEPKQLIRALVHGVGNDFGTAPESLVPCELPSRMQAPAADVLATVSRAICQKAILQIEYLSDSGNHGPREIVPYTLAGTGLKWQVRAFCRRKKIFSDFILNRIKKAEVLGDMMRLSEESKQNDDEWNRMIKLELIPHPARTPEQRAMTEQEFRMTNGVHVLRVRGALAGYVLRLWSVDCSPTRRLEKFPLCLRNLIALHDVDTVGAPGYEKSG